MNIFRPDDNDAPSLLRQAPLQRAVCDEPSASFGHLVTAASMTKARLKGGSLSGTYLCTPSDGLPFVRKEVSLTANREYGFQRWY